MAVTALYVHVPFCAQKCRYCDFDSRSFAPCDLSAALDGIPVPARSSVERLDALREHLTLTHELLPLMSRARTYASWYLKGMPHAVAWRAHVVRCSTYEEFMALVDEIEHDVVACEAALAAGESVPPHPLEA